MAARCEVQAGLRNSSASPVQAHSRSAAIFATFPVRLCRPCTSPRASNGFWRRMDTKIMRRARPLLGTFVEIRSSGATRAGTERAIDAAFATIESEHRLMSFHDAGSDVWRLNRDAHDRAVAVDPWTYRVLETALDLHRRSGGVFDIAVASMLQRLGLLPGRPEAAEQALGATATSAAI